MARRFARIRPPKRHEQWFREHMSLYAARLCAELHGEPLPETPSSYHVGPGQCLTAKRWNQLMAAICSRVYVVQALRQLGIREWVFRCTLRREPRLHAWHKRAVHLSKSWRWPGLLEMDEVLNTLVTSPGMSARSACKLHGVDYLKFLKQTRTPEWESRYLRTKRLQEHRSLDALGAKLDAPDISRATVREFNQGLHAMKRLEPRRLWRRQTLKHNPWRIEL